VKEEIIRRRGRYAGTEEQAQETAAGADKKKLFSARPEVLEQHNRPFLLFRPRDIHAELESGPNGEIQTVAQRIPLCLRGSTLVKAGLWQLQRGIQVHVVVLDLAGKPVQDRDVKYRSLPEKILFSQEEACRGFYSYEHVTETKEDTADL